MKVKDVDNLDEKWLTCLRRQRVYVPKLTFLGSAVTYYVRMQIIYVSIIPFNSIGTISIQQAHIFINK